MGIIQYLRNAIMPPTVSGALKKGPSKASVALGRAPMHSEVWYVEEFMATYRFACSDGEIAVTSSYGCTLPGIRNSDPDIARANRRLQKDLEKIAAAGLEIEGEEPIMFK